MADDDDDLRAFLPFLAPERHEHTHTHRTDVTVKRAPTDESVRLLKEMEKAAQDKLVSSVRVEANAFKCIVHQWVDHAADDVKMRAIFDLNGRQMSADITGSTRERRVDERVIWRRLVDAIAQEIATHAIQEAFRAYIKR